MTAILLRLGLFFVTIYLIARFITRALGGARQSNPTTTRPDLERFRSMFYEALRRRGSPPSAAVVSDPYKLLGITPTTTPEEVKARYLELVSQTKSSFTARGFAVHDPSCQEELQRLQFAYQTVSKFGGT